MKSFKLFSLLSIGLFFFSSCLKDKGEVKTIVYTPEELQILQKTLKLDDELIDYAVNLPSHIASSGGATPSIDNSKAILGRVLFYDKNLSKNNAVSCASCHDQAIAFSDDVAFSEGFDGEHTKRNSLALGAVVNFETSYDSPIGPRSLFFWDERAITIAEQSTLTIQDNIEMGMDFSELVPKLKNLDYYQVLFNKAFRSSDPISQANITSALEEFVNSLASADSKFDQAVAANHGSHFGNLSKLSTKENTGKDLYTNNCASCHGSDLVALSRTIANNGLDIEYEDKGRYEVTQSNSDKGLFKVPVLRNIELTAPYMHDGRFETLEEVVDHYSEGIQAHPNLDASLRQGFNGEPLRMNFTDNEKEALVAFLKTLTDYEFIADEKFSDPFL